ncbi:hypothetical protein BC829DRAFT_417425 [Chytridium lagenaria]|nr:hypothetical protein BC829DRAFT_417425 [Chytridium lagenaria]
MTATTAQQPATTTTRSHVLQEHLEEHDEGQKGTRQYIKVQDFNAIPRPDAPDLAREGHYEEIRISVEQTVKLFFREWLSELEAEAHNVSIPRHPSEAAYKEKRPVRPHTDQRPVREAARRKPSMTVKPSRHKNLTGPQKHRQQSKWRRGKESPMGSLKEKARLSKAPEEEVRRHRTRVRGSKLWEVKTFIEILRGSKVVLPLLEAVSGDPVTEVDKMMESFIEITAKAFVDMTKEHGGERLESTENNRKRDADIYECHKRVGEDIHGNGTIISQIDEEESQWTFAAGKPLEKGDVVTKVIWGIHPNHWNVETRSHKGKELVVAVCDIDEEEELIRVLKAAKFGIKVGKKQSYKSKKRWLKSKSNKTNHTTHNSQVQAMPLQASKAPDDTPNDDPANDAPNDNDSSNESTNDGDLKYLGL